MSLALRLAALGAVIAAAIHATALAVPAFAAAAYPPAYPAWRHGVFITINLSTAWLFRRRPWWFVWAYTVLTAQVLHSHGSSAWASWQRDGRVAWIDAAAILAVLVALVLLVMDYRKRA